MSQSSYARSDDHGYDTLESSYVQLEGAGDEDLSSFEEDLNDEALDALEASLKQKLESLVLEQRQWDEEIDASMAFMEDLNTTILKQTEEVKEVIANEEADLKEVIQLRDQSLSELRSVEQAFSDVHRKYERAKLALRNAKATEEIRMQRDEDLQISVAEADAWAEKRKVKAHSDLEQSEKEGTSCMMSSECENVKLTAVHRRAEMHVETLLFDLKQKKSSNLEMSKLVDELIEKNSRM